MKLTIETQAWQTALARGPQAEAAPSHLDSSHAQGIPSTISIEVDDSCRKEFHNIGLQLKYPKKLYLGGELDLDTAGCDGSKTGEHNDRRVFSVKFSDGYEQGSLYFLEEKIAAIVANSSAGYDNTFGF